MSRKFNLKDYKGKYVMCCKTEEEAKDFCRVMHESDRTWSMGQSYADETYWGKLLHNGKSPIYYKFNDGLWGITDHTSVGYIVLHWSDFMQKEFTKDDLRNGDVILRRDGEVSIYIESNFIAENGCTYSLRYISDNLIFINVEHYSDRDIIAVRRPNDISDMTFDAFEKKLGRLVYERDETVEMTIEEVCKALGKNVKIVKG